MSENFANKVLNLSPKRLALLAVELHERLEKMNGWPIAIVGAGCRLPGGIATAESFWSALLEGKDAVTCVPEERWAIDDFYDPAPGVPGRMYTREGGFLADIDLFDAGFFGISAREAVRMDPQQRVLLEVAWEALENAGQAPDVLRGAAAGVFVGITTCDYAALLQEAGSFSHADLFGISGTALNAAPGRVSYSLGLTGPSIAVDTACSSSLVAVHQAGSALAAGECEIALAGGVNLILTPYVHILASQAQMLARDGRSKTFDQSADGFGRGEACVLLVLKRLADALAARDRIIAVLAGTAVNHGGASGGFSVPSPKAQSAVITRALESASVEPREIGFVESHGTGTALGDPIEVRALADALNARLPGRRPVWLGAAKSNFGHSESAAGAVSLLKAAFAVQNGIVPPNLHCTTPNRAIEWNELPFRLPRVASPWFEGYRRRVAGVSSFGMSGTNAHAIVTEPPAYSPDESRLPETGVLPISARSRAALLQMVERYRDFLRNEVCWADVCFTASTGRTHFDHRIAVVAPNSSTARDLLDEWLRQEGVEGQILGFCRDAEWMHAAASYVEGGRVHWPDLWNAWRVKRVALPTYCFERQRYWVQPVAARSVSVIPSLYKLRWKPMAVASGRGLSGRWLVIDEDENSALVRRLREAGADAVIVQSISDNFRTLPADSYSGVVVSFQPIAPLLSVDGRDGSEFVNKLLHRLLVLARWIGACGESYPIWFLTRGAHTIGAEPPNALSAALGFLRTLARENSNRWLGLCDLDAGEHFLASLAPLPDVLSQTAESQIAIRSGQVHTLRLEDESAVFHQFSPRDDRTYLITGGLGGVGEICARLLLERGARHLVLTGHRELDQERRSRLESISSGRPVVFRRNDVSSIDETVRLFSYLRENHPPVGGIIHSALFLSDRPAAMLSDEDAQAILAPKVAGTWNLHQCSLDQPLEFFVLLSSVSGVLGNGGQSAYAAGNTFQDAFAHARRQAGLPALCIDLGPVEGTGAIRRMVSRRQFPPLVRTLTIDETSRAIETLLSAPETQYVLCSLDKDRMNQLSPNDLPSILRDLQSTPKASQSRTDFTLLLQNTSADARQRQIETWLRNLAGGVLEQSAASLEPDRPLQEYGLDSLLSLELRNRLATESSRELPASLLFDYPTLESLQLYFSRLFSTPEDNVFKKSKSTQSSATMSDDEAAALLERMANEVLSSEGVV